MCASTPQDMHSKIYDKYMLKRPDNCETSFVCNLVIDYQTPAVWKVTKHWSPINYLTEDQVTTRFYTDVNSISSNTSLASPQDGQILQVTI